MQLSLERTANSSMYLPNVTPMFRHIEVKYLPSGLSFHRHREPCTEVRSSKGSPLFERSGGSENTEGTLPTGTETPDNAPNPHTRAQSFYFAIIFMYHLLKSGMF